MVFLESDGDAGHFIPSYYSLHNSAFSQPLLMYQRLYVSCRFFDRTHAAAFGSYALALTLAPALEATLESTRDVG